jgi:hypothetical protein
MRSNHRLGIGIWFVLASFGLGTARAADCVVAAPDGISKAFARGQLDAGAQRIFDEAQRWGRNPLEQAAEGKFTGQPRVTEYKVGEETYQKIPFSLLNREAVLRINFGNDIVEGDPAKPLTTADQAKPLATADQAKPLATADQAKPLATADQAKPGLIARFALSAKTQFAPPPTFWLPPIIVVVVPTFSTQWTKFEFEPSYTVAIKAKPSC